MKTKTALFTSLRTILVAAIAAIHSTAAPAAPVSPSELLEKGIYNQETKGDLDSAIAIYQQLVAEANVNQSLAAEAQFRLGQCYLKKGRTGDANAAFEKLIHEFPNEKELVAKARDLLPGKLTLGPVPWANGERMQLTISLPSGVDIGVCEYRADFVAGDNKAWGVGARGLLAGAQSVSRVEADAETFRPIKSHWKHSQLGEVWATYRTNEVEIHRAGSSPATVQIDSPIYDNEEAMYAMRRLPLQVGYKTTLPIIVTLSGASIQIGLEVVGKETVEVPAGKFDCVKVHLGVINQDFWFSDDAHRYLVKFEAGPATAHLTSVVQRRRGEPVAFQDKQLGISFVAPPGWVVWRAMHGQPEGQVLIRTLDPDADTTDGGMRLFATDTLSETARQSARAWADEMTGWYKTHKVRPDSWQTITIDGRPAVSCVTDFTEGGQPSVQYLAFVLGAKNSEMFVLTTAPKKFDALKAQFETSSPATGRSERKPFQFIAAPHGPGRPRLAHAGVAARRRGRRHRMRALVHARSDAQRTPGGARETHRGLPGTTGAGASSAFGELETVARATRRSTIRCIRIRARRGLRRPKRHHLEPVSELDRRAQRRCQRRVACRRILEGRCRTIA